MLLDLIRRNRPIASATAIPAISAIPWLEQAKNELGIAKIAAIALAVPNSDTSDALIQRSDYWLIDGAILLTTSPAMTIAEVQAQYPEQHVVSLSNEQWQAFPDELLVKSTKC